MNGAFVLAKQPLSTSSVEPFNGRQDYTSQVALTFGPLFSTLREHQPLDRGGEEGGYSLSQNHGFLASVLG